MQTITLINTRHESLGTCNSNALLDIFETIKPQVFFQEFPPSHTDIANGNLESITIDRYKKMNNTAHILVDSENIPNEQFFNDLEKMYHLIDNLPSQNGQSYRKLVDDNKFNIYTSGFQYLNSKHTEDYNFKLNSAIHNCIIELNNIEYSNLYKQWTDINEDRENIMIKNIYNYSLENLFSQGVFLIGSGHRNSIITKIKNHNKRSNHKINWIFDYKMDSNP